MNFSICIATYKRPRLLEKLLFSLVDQKLPAGAQIEILVIDNSSQQEARPIIENFSKNYPGLFYYEVQKIKNISITRNLAVKRAKGEYILFIDDDEYAEINWIFKLFETLIHYNADAVFGKVISYFDVETPEWIRKSFIYNRLTSETGSIATATRTGNCIVKASLLKNLENPFNEKYGVSGGSDTDLFERLRKNGAKFINCKEAITYEYVPKERTSMKWLKKRAFRGGNDFVRHSIELSPNNLKYLIRIKYLFIGLTYFILSLIFYIGLSPLKYWRNHWRLKIFANLGKVSATLGYLPNEYA